MEHLVELYRRLADLSRQQARCVAADDLERLGRLVEERDALLAAADELLPVARASDDSVALARILGAAREAAAAEEAAIQALTAGLATIRHRLRQAGDGRAAIRSYRPGGSPGPMMDRYST